MSITCPLCGKNKQNEALFCEQCTKKIRADYEIDVPKTSKKEEFTQEISEVMTTEPTKESAAVHESAEENQSSRSLKSLLVMVLSVIVVLGCFFIVKNVAFTDNVEETAWETAVQGNSIPHFLEFIDAFPRSKKAELVRENILRIRQMEAMEWEKVCNTSNPDELHDFLMQFPDSPHGALVKVRLDSLSWAVALNENTVESFSQYLILQESGEFRGEFYLEAQQRRDMLLQSFPVNQQDLASIRESINGFYTAVSQNNVVELERFLASTVNRFFSFGEIQRDQMTNAFLVAIAKSNDSGMTFTPNLNALQYEKNADGEFLVNVPLVKVTTEGSRTIRTAGFIAHFILDTEFRIMSIYETHP